MVKRQLLKLLPPTCYLHLRRWNFKRVAKDKFNHYQARRQIAVTEGYSFKPFDDTKTIFIHIPKCAGVSINHQLYGNLAGGHTRFDQYLDIFEPACISSYFTFTIVRNPWDRLVSAYHFLKNGGFSEKDAQWYHSELSRYENFDDFVKGWVTEENVKKWYHFHPQHLYFLDAKDKVKIDFFGFFENLDNDFALITQKLGSPATLPVSNRGKHKDYKEYYTDETREIVARVYAKDIALLGYNFDNSSLPHQLSRRPALV